MFAVRSSRSVSFHLAVVVLSLLASACGHDQPTTPSNAGLTGTWASSDLALRWELVQSGDVVTGTEIVVETGARTPISGLLHDGRFDYRVVTRETTEHFTPDTSVQVQWGWGVSTAVEGDRMSGSMYWFGSPGQYSRLFHPLTIVKVHAR